MLQLKADEVRLWEECMVALCEPGFREGLSCGDDMPAGIAEAAPLAIAFADAIIEARRERLERKES